MSYLPAVEGRYSRFAQKLVLTEVARVGEDGESLLNKWLRFVPGLRSWNDERSIGKL